VLGAGASCGSGDDKKNARGSDAGAGGEESLAEGGGGASIVAPSGGDGDGGSARSGSAGAVATDAGADAGGAGSGLGGAAGAPNEPNPLDRYLDPSAGADSNDGTSAPLAFRTFSHALGEMQSGGTLWLLDGAIGGGSSEPVGTGYNSLDIPDGVSVRAINDGAVTVGEGVGGMNPPSFTFLGSGSLRGVSFDGVAVPIRASTGTVELEALTFKDAGGGCDSFSTAALVISGDAQVTLSAGSVDEYAGAGSNVRNFAYVSDTASLTILGGTFTELASGVCSPRSHFLLTHSAKLELSDVSIVDASATARGGIVGLLGPSTELVMTGSSIDGSIGSAPGLYVDGGGSAKITLVDSIITNNTSAAIQLGYENGPLTPQLSLTGSTISNSWNGIISSVPYGPANPTITLVDSFVVDNAIAGMYLSYGGTLDVSGGELSGNGNNQETYWGTYGGLRLGGGYTYDVKLRGVALTGTPAFGGLTTAAIQITASAESNFDFGTVDEPGSNVFTGNTRTALELMTGNAATVHAVGNTWNASVQGATAQGKYSAPPASQTSVTSGSGTNYIVMAGTLVLAESP
jgi:hypothetical protein